MLQTLQLPTQTHSARTNAFPTTTDNLEKVPMAERSTAHQEDFRELSQVAKPSRTLHSRPAGGTFTASEADSRDADLFLFPGELGVFVEDESKWQLLKILQTPDTFLTENDHVSAGIHKTMTLLLC